MISKILFYSSLLFIFSLTSCKFNEDQTVLFNNVNGIAIDKLKTDISGLSTTTATIKTSHGNIVFRFYTKAAPQTSARIMQLIQNKYYDGMNFHRVIQNFIVQTGDSTGTGNGGSGTKIKDEFNEIQHIKGIIGLAHGPDANSGDSQFYICLTTLTHLDGKNTVFGQVVDGLEILSKISKGDIINSITLNIKD